ncbi:hypothetical protein HBH56_156630 [Parastagonospora nodorum]|uniref:Uncharacterized protein n=1 Tax=Phaeosphaeria nodorum (strain SN15 / ATCC MYA-4574 / FGSC 10173) TaxID=321614 RepID=A0A7U2I303_PHANO|nr:hypothetical protein HBH56_156630 [Parastagonospora nodorum]QRC97527.1 hypothetical protein JI435_434960 [Parastagonospora nodorum SN15]KAH3922988.1 hypothetical protein HBH54_218100 [Parastagonospora nodorum]KAH3973474.1 hypothetical protein HBH51_098470 [Parastagonospora nodorum]KAH4002611.1 hypothetical protein HBI10_074790 [Parastagonospora nodorum]
MPQRVLCESKEVAIGLSFLDGYTAAAKHKLCLGNFIERHRYETFVRPYGATSPQFLNGRRENSAHTRKRFTTCWQSQAMLDAFVANRGWYRISIGPILMPAQPIQDLDFAPGPTTTAKVSCGTHCSATRSNTPTAAWTTNWGVAALRLDTFGD